MRYHSTRSATEFVSGPEAILQGLAPDGGLYVPENLPKLDIPQLLKKNLADYRAVLSDNVDVKGAGEE